MYTSTPCLTRQHSTCADAACRCTCHRRPDGTNQGPGNKSTKVEVRAIRQPNFWTQWNADAAKRRLIRDGVLKIDDDTIKLANANPNDVVGTCADCHKKMTKAEGGLTFAVCDNCWDKNVKGKSPAERKAQRAARTNPSV